MTWLKTLMFLLFVPGSVVFLLPYHIARRTREVDLGFLRWAALPAWLSGAVLLLASFWNFAFRGRGTPHPADPPKELVVSGPYRFTRNPQYLGVILLLLGHFTWSGALLLAPYALLVFILFNIFIRFYEEPTLQSRFGDSYRRYKQRVPRWL
jgi:protein-S-isoprenylcysteine O-methyltransferase Ste14